MGNSNFQLLVDAAKLLKPILGERVFVAGCTTGLLITDKAAADVRSPYDVDAMAEITSYVGYSEFSERLKALGFREDTREGPPLCRWCQQTTTLDVMPLDGKILGFKNTWYGPAMETAKEHELEPGLMILMVNPVYFCASKLADLASQERITTVMGRPKKSPHFHRGAKREMYQVCASLRIRRVHLNAPNIETLPYDHLAWLS
jgi:hypothetical protein